jgi:Holliday junction resolvase-like predicted endonuclease
MIGNKTGKLGEDIAVMFLKKRGFTDFTCNYNRKWGEIDIIASKGGVRHFVEVKAVTRESLDTIDGVFSRVTPVEDRSIRPEENLHGWKLKRLSRVIQTYLIEHKEVKDWKFDLCVVYVDTQSKKARVKLIEDLVLPE